MGWWIIGTDHLFARTSGSHSSTREKSPNSPGLDQDGKLADEKESDEGQVVSLHGGSQGRAVDPLEHESLPRPHHSTAWKQGVFYRPPHPVSREVRAGTYCEDYEENGCAVSVCPEGCWQALAP